MWKHAGNLLRREHLPEVAVDSSREPESGVLGADVKAMEEPREEGCHSDDGEGFVEREGDVPVWRHVDHKGRLQKEEHQRARHRLAEKDDVGRQAVLDERRRLAEPVSKVAVVGGHRVHARDATKERRSTTLPLVLKTLFLDKSREKKNTRDIVGTDVFFFGTNAMKTHTHTHNSFPSPFPFKGKPFHANLQVGRLPPAVPVQDEAERAVHPTCGRRQRSGEALLPHARLLPSSAERGGPEPGTDEAGQGSTRQDVAHDDFQGGA